MEIRIDTEKDSLDEIRKVIKFLQDYVGEHSSESYESSSLSTESKGMFNIFGEDDENTASSETEATETDMFGNVLGSDDEDDDDDINIVP